MALTTEALRLPPEQRLKLIEQLWESLVASPASLPVSDSDLKELERRRKRYRADPASLIDWQELKSRLAKPPGDAH